MSTQIFLCIKTEICTVSRVNFPVIEILLSLCLLEWLYWFVVVRRVQVDVSGYRWIQVNTGGYKWIHMDTIGYRWIQVVGGIQMYTSKYMWAQVDTDGYKWIEVDTIGYRWWEGYSCVQTGRILIPGLGVKMCPKPNLNISH